MVSNENLIVALHKQMLLHSHKDSRHKGIYKIAPNRVEAKDPSGNIVGIIFDPTPPHLVGKEIQELITWYQFAKENQTKHILILLTNFIFERLAIHPFQDVNGRTSRLITNLLLLQEGYLFSKIVSHKKIIEQRKTDYYLALNQVQQTWKTNHENIKPWIRFFLGIMKQQAQEALTLLQSDQTDNLLTHNQRQIWQWALARGEFTRKEAIEAFQMPPRTIEYSIAKLLELGKIKRYGTGRGTAE